MSTQKENHIKELEALGAVDGIKAYRTLRRIEKEAHYWAEVSCNGGILVPARTQWDGRAWHKIERERIIPRELSEEEENKIYSRLEKRVKRVFGGMLPVGFMFNGDPRGYSLKIKTEANNLPNGERVISYTDWGGYGILAPDFSEGS